MVNQIIVLPDGSEVEFPSEMSDSDIKQYLISKLGEQALRPAPSVMTDNQRQQARELAKQYEQPKSFGDKVSEWAVTKPLGRGIGLGLQGVANSYLNPAGYIARGMGVDTRPLEPQNTTERVIEAGAGGLYDTAVFMPVGKAIGSSQLVGNLAKNSNKAISMAGKGIQALATPAAPAYELAGGFGGASLPAAVNLEAPSEDASFGDKAKYYAANTVLALLGGIGGMSVVGGGRALAKQGLNKYGFNADGSLNMELSKDVLTNNDKGVIIDSNGGKDVKQISENGFGGQVRLQQEPLATTTNERGGISTVDSTKPNKEEQIAALGELVGTARNIRGLNQDGLFSRGIGGRGFSVNPKYSDMFDKANVSKSSYLELDKTPEESRRFFDAITKAKEDLGAVGEQVYVYTPEEYLDMKLFLSEDGLSGIAVKPDGDIVSVFNSATKQHDKGSRAHALIELALQNGGKKLDAFDTFLPKLYSKHGFKEVGRDAWNEDFAPPKWDKDYFRNWNNGEPDVVYMQLEEPILPQAPIPEELPQTPLNPEKGISRLTSKERLAQNPNLSAEAKANLSDSATYDILHNQDLTMQAIADVNANPDMVRNSLLEKDFYTAQDFEDARLLASRLFSEGKTEDALTLIRTVSEKGSKAGQSVQAMSLWSQMTPEGAVRNAQKMVDNYNALNPKQQVELTPEQTKKIMDLQTKAMSLPDGSREKEVYTALSLKAQEEMIPTSLGDKVRSYRNQSMLLNPKTLGRNILGNMSFASMEKGLTDPIAALIDKGLSKFTGQRTRAMSQFGDYLKGLGRGAKQGVEDVNLGINTRKIGGRFDTGTRPAFDGGVLGKTEKALAYGLQVPDRAFYEATYAESLANQMKAKGVKKTTKEMENIAEQEALEAVFQNKGLISDTVNKFRGGLNKLSKEGLEVAGIRLSDGSLGLGDMLIPYAQTPANLTQQAINYSPLGAIKGFGNLAKGNQRQATKDLARSVVGTGGIGAGYTLAKEGLLTGDLNPENLSTKDAMERRRNLELMGIRPNQIWIGDKGYSYGPFNPVSTMLSAGAKLAEGGDTLDATLSAGATLADLPFLSNVNKFHRDLVYQGMGDAIKNQAAGLPSQFIPTLSSQTADMFDDTVKETYDPNTFKQGLNVALNKIPFARDVLPDRIDVVGRPMDKYSSEGMGKLFDAYVNPTFVNERKDNPVVQELERLYQTTGESKHFLPLADRKININGERKKLKPEHATLRQKALGKSNYGALIDLMNSDYYNRLPDDKRVEEINKIQKQVNQGTTERLFTGSKKQNLYDKKIKQIERKINKPIDNLRKLKVNNIINDVMSELY